MAGQLVYFVIPVADAERAKRFYGGVFEWGFAPGNVEGGYQIEGTSPPGGLFAGTDSDTPQVYFSVDDIDEALARVRALGGQAGEPHEIASGFMAACRDDQGVDFNLWAPPRE